MTSLSLTKRAIQGIQIKWEVLKNSYAFIFFSCKFYAQFSWTSCRQLWHPTFFRGKKFKTIYLSEHKSVSSKRNAKRHLKLTKKFLPYHHFWKTWSYLWTADLILWILQLRGWAHGAQGWVCMLLNVIICYHNIKELKCSYKDLHHKTLTTVF